MSLLELRDVGKIYVSASSTAVGIRGISLSFERGEFVTVTGKSGSGKTTLLNVMSGIDTYEEGELLIEGEPTSHYTQDDFEAYRQKYISFIFQDYNIIESFTVLQNVELALSDLPDRRTRRKRALELIERVGLSPFKNSRGSKLSGGQKQRTVIARALAKDSPIILADEPTGNLDAKTGDEIIKLLHEVSEDKLVIIVTHSASQLSEYATREIRIFDGAVERDETIREAKVCKAEVVAQEKRIGTVKRGFELGAFRFFAKPKLSFFMCMLMVLGILGVFFVTSLFLGNITGGSSKIPMFTYTDGRVVVTRQDRNPITEEELGELASSTGAESYMYFDSILDRTESYNLLYNDRIYYTDLKFTKSAELTPSVGRLPEGEREAMLVVPISFKEIYGEGEIQNEELKLFNDTVTLTVVGIRYYYDNTVEYGQIVLTDEGFESLKYADFFNGSYYKKQSAMSVRIERDGNTSLSTDIRAVGIDPELKGGEYYFVHGYDTSLIADGEYVSRGEGVELTYNIYSSDRMSEARKVLSSVKLEGITYVKEKTLFLEDSPTAIYISKETAEQIFGASVGSSYTQASLFYVNDTAAKVATDLLFDKGYIAALSSSTVNEDDTTAILNFVLSIISVSTWLLFVVFISFFIYLCSAKGFLSMQGDIAIMRSMGIEKNVLKLSNLVFTLISLIPAVLALAILATVIYTSPSLNSIFTFLHAPEYFAILAGVLILAARISAMFNKKMFDNSVRKTLRGGEVA